MPPPNRTARLSQKNAQSTLSFGARSKITKPSASTKSLKKDAAIISDVKDPVSPVAEVDIPPTTAEVAIEEQAREEVQKVVRTKEEELALEVNDTQLRRYWKAREAERRTPRGLSP